MKTLRSNMGEFMYKKYLETNPDMVKNIKEQDPIYETRHWIIVKNKFPYDCKTHDMLLPKRVVAHFESLYPAELKEFYQLRKKLYEEYDSFIEHTHKSRSIHDWFHLHLIVW